MCGIAGIVHSQPSSQVDLALLERMCARLCHRGPDDQGSSSRDPWAWEVVA